MNFDQLVGKALNRPGSRNCLSGPDPRIRAPPVIMKTPDRMSCRSRTLAKVQVPKAYRIGISKADPDCRTAEIHSRSRQMSSLASGGLAGIVRGT